MPSFLSGISVFVSVTALLRNVCVGRHPQYTVLKGRMSLQPGTKGYTANVTRAMYWEGKPQAGGRLCSGEKQQRTEQQTDFIQSFLGVELSRVGIGRISGPELGLFSP